MNKSAPRILSAYTIRNEKFGRQRQTKKWVSFAGNLLENKPCRKLPVCERLIIILMLLYFKNARESDDLVETASMLQSMWKHDYLFKFVILVYINLFWDKIGNYINYIKRIERQQRKWEYVIISSSLKWNEGGRGQEIIMV